MRDRRGQSLAEVLSRQICGLIIDEKLKPGDPLPTEYQLQERFSIGRGTLREAIVRLRALGIVVVRHGQGTFVAELPAGSPLKELSRAVTALRKKAHVQGYADIEASLQCTETVIERHIADEQTEAANGPAS